MLLFAWAWHAPHAVLPCRTPSRAAPQPSLPLRPALQPRAATASCSVAEPPEAELPSAATTEALPPLFAQITPSPVAVASLGQVYKALTHVIPLMRPSPSR